MKITRVTAEPLEHARVPQLLVHVEDDAGNLGTGECWWGVATMQQDVPGDTLAPIAATVDKLLGPRCIGWEAGRIERIWGDLMRYAYRYGDEGILRCALSGIDLALWDLLGKRLAQPVSQLLGGTVHDALPVYASLPGQRELAPLLAEVQRALAAGFTAVKVHEFDVDLVLALRDALGPDPILMVDALGRFPPATAAHQSQRLAEARLTFLETPLYPMRDYRLLARLRRDSPIPLAVGEHEWSFDGFERLFKSESVSFVQPEICKIGGLTFARRIGTLAELYGVPLCPHAYRLGPGFNATLHWAFASPGAVWVEVPFLPEGIDFPSGAVLPPLVNGCANLPPGVGLGDCRR